MKTGKDRRKVRKKQKKKLLKASLGRDRIRSLVTAALSIPSVGLSFNANAQTPPESPTVKLFYSYYEDRQKGAERMRIHEPIFWFKTPIKEDWELESSFTLDSMSGASTYYHNTLTGASGLGVEDTRRAGDVKVTKYFEDFSVGIGGVVSSEDDYISRTGLLETRFWTPDKNRTYTFGFSGSSDDISSTIADSLDESRKTFNFMSGISQVIDQNSIGQINLTYANGDGYFSDPYKTLDNRPQSREQWALLGRYVRYIEALEASLHTDYRYYVDTWGVDSHMFETAWYQPVASFLTLRPGVRYYTQDSADFFTDVFPPEELDHFLSADQRLSAFGGVTLSMKVIAELGKGFAFDVGVNYLEQRPEWRLGGGGSDVIDPFSAWFFTTGLTKSF